MLYLLRGIRVPRIVGSTCGLRYQVMSLELLPIVPAPLRETGGASLEWPRLREHVAESTSSPLGRAWLLALEPSTDLPWIVSQHKRTSEIRGMISAGGSFDFHGLFDPTSLLDEARVEGVALDGLNIEPSSSD